MGSIKDTEIKLNSGKYTVIQSDGEYLYVSNTDDYIGYIRDMLIDECKIRLKEIANGEVDIDPEDSYSWDSPEGVQRILDDLQEVSNSDDESFLDSVWEWHICWWWIKVFDANNGNLIFESYGNQL